MDPLLPNTDDLALDPSWYWRNDKFGLPPEELFTTLYDRFNTKQFALQDPVSFHRDVRECAETAETRDEFYAELEKRRTKRIGEMSEAWKDIKCWLSAFPQNMFCQICYNEETMEVKVKSNSLNDGPAARSRAFNNFARTMSFDALIVLFDGFARDERKKQEDERCRRMEKRKRFESERAAECLAAPSRAPGATASDPTSHSSHRTASNKPKSSQDASTINPPFPAATISDKPKATWTSRRRDPDQPEVLAQARTAKSLTRKRSDESDENANGPKKKKQCVMSARDGDAERRVGQEKQRAAEASPTLGQAKKRKRVDEVDDFQNDARKKQPRIIDDPDPSVTQSPKRAAAELDTFAQDKTASEATSLFSVTTSHHYNLDMTDEEGDQRELRRLESNSSVSTGNNLSFTITQLSPNEDTGDRDALTAKISTISAGTGGLDRLSRRKRQPRGEQRSLTPKKQTRQRQEQYASSLVKQILQSNRSSRRGPAQKLFFLSNNGTTCAVVTKKRN